MKGSVSSSQAMLVLFFSPPESPLLRGLPMTVTKGSGVKGVDIHCSLYTVADVDDTQLHGNNIM